MADAERTLVDMPIEILRSRLKKGVLLADCCVVVEAVELVDDDEELVLVLVLEVELEVLVGIATVVDDEVSSSSPMKSFSQTTMLAFSPLGTVTTQKEPPPAPSVVVSPVISLTSLVLGSILQGSPSQLLLSHWISAPKSGTMSRKGVVGSR